MPEGLPDGQCIVRLLPGDLLSVEHADPRVIISTELLDLIASGPLPLSRPRHPLTEGHCRLEIPDDGLDRRGWYEGCLLKIAGVNRTVIYRIGEYVPAVHSYVAEWPD
jgi:hypothetical protein